MSKKGLKLSSSLFSHVVKTSSEEFDHLVTPVDTEKKVDLGKERATSNHAEEGHKKFAGYYEDFLQGVLNQIHDKWQPGMSKEDLLSSLPTNVHKMVFALAKLNYQVQNGGFEQWIDNGYAGDGQGDLLLSELPESGKLGDIKNLLYKLNGIISSYAEQNGEDYSGFDDAESILSSSQDSDDMWKEFIRNNESEVDRIDSVLGIDLENRDTGLDIDLSALPTEIVQNLPNELDDESDCEAWMEFVYSDEVENHLDETLIGDLQVGLPMLYDLYREYSEYESNGGNVSTLRNEIGELDNRYYQLTENQEEYFKEVAHFLETLEPTTASLKQAFKVGSLISPLGSRPFIVASLVNTADDIKIQAKFLDGSTEVLNKKALARINKLTPELRRFASMMIKAYNKDFDLYVKTAIREAGLPVDEDMNWSSYLEKAYRSISNDPEIRDEAAHHEIIEHLYRLKTLDKFDPDSSPAKDAPLDKKVTIFLKTMFSYSVSKARAWVAKNYGYGHEVQPEIGVNEDGGSVNILDTVEHGVSDTHSDLESSSDVKEFKKEFEPWLIRRMGKKVGPNLSVLFDLSLKYDDSEDIWNAFSEKTGKSYSYYKKAIVNLASLIKEFIGKGIIHPSNLLVRLVNDYNSKLNKIEQEAETAKESNLSEGEPVMSSAKELKDKKKEIEAKKASVVPAKKESKLAALIASKKAKLAKYATLRRIAEEETDDVAEAVAELRDLFMQNVEQLDNLMENLNLDVESLDKEGAWGQGLKRAVEEEPEEVENALVTVYNNIDQIAEGIENLATNLGIDLEPEENELVENVEEQEEKELEEKTETE